MREEEKKPTSKLQRILKKRWALPAIYISSAALILILAFIVQTTLDHSSNQNKGENSTETGQNIDQPSVEVNSSLEKIKMPVADVGNTVIKKQFYDVNSNEKQQEAALVVYNNRYEPNKGIDIAQKDGKAFDVVASLSGVVTKVQEDSLLGNVIEVEHEDGVVTRYQSVTDIKVAVGDEVKQGMTIATAGKSQIDSAAGTHVHFEIRKDNVAVNPSEYIDKQVSTIQTKVDTQKDATNSSEQSKNVDMKNKDNSSSSNANDTTTKQPAQ